MEIPATVTAFVFEEDGTPVPALRQHAQKQQKEKTRWLNTPNTYLRVNVADEVQRSMGTPRPKTTVRRAEGALLGEAGAGEVPSYIYGLCSFKVGEQNRSPQGTCEYKPPLGFPFGSSCSCPWSL